MSDDHEHHDRPVRISLEVDAKASDADIEKGVVKPAVVMSKFQIRSLIAVVIFTAISAIASGFFWTDANSTLDDVQQQALDNSGELEDINARQEALDREQADFRAQSRCLNNALEATIIALQARAQFAEETTRTNLRVINSQIEFLMTLRDASTNPDPTPPEQTLSIYLDALRDAKTGLHDQLTIRERVPYPFITAIKSCKTVTAENPDPTLLEAGPDTTPGGD